MPNEIERPEGHCVHVIGVGRTGGVYVEALLRTGEVEDNLATAGATLSALLVDIGDNDAQIPNDYARSMKSRIKQRNIPSDRYHYEFLDLVVPEKDEFAKKLDAVRAPFSAGGGASLIEKLPAGFDLPKPGRHTPRGLARAVGAFNLQLDSKPLAGALERFADTVKKCAVSSTVFVAFSLAGGTGSTVALDIARALQRMNLGPSVRIVGVAQLGHSGDRNHENNPAQTLAIEEIDRIVNGPAEGNPFPQGCFIVSTEHSWQRLTAYTSTGLKEVRQHFKQLVTNRFVSDSFMRWAVEDGSTHLDRVLTASPSGGCMMFNVAKLSHPGVQVLPGEPRSRWDSVLQQWVHAVPEYSGLAEGYSANGADVHIYCARYMQMELVEDELRKLITAKYLGSGAYRSYRKEFFDELTAYANIIFPKVRKDDLSSYQTGKGKLAEIDKTSLQLETA